MDPGPEGQPTEGMEDGHHSDSSTATQGSEYMTDSGTDTDEELHCGAEPYWVDEAAIMHMGPCSLECPAHIMPEDFRVMLEAGHVNLTYGMNPRTWLDKKYRRCACERMVE